MTFEEFEIFIMTPSCFEQHDVSYIDSEGLQHYFDQSDYWQYTAAIATTFLTNNTIKVEQMEKVLSAYRDGTVHVFYNKDNGYSFDTHTDPVDVLIKCLDGVKHMAVEGIHKRLLPGDELLMKAGTEHRALNYEKALMLSYGIRDTETTHRICKDN